MMSNAGAGQDNSYVNNQSIDSRSQPESDATPTAKPAHVHHQHLLPDQSHSMSRNSAGPRRTHQMPISIAAEGYAPNAQEFESLPPLACSKEANLIEKKSNSTTMTGHMKNMKMNWNAKRFSATHGPKRSRLLLKHGYYNMVGKNIPHHNIRLVTDLWNTLIELKWRYVLLLFLISYFLTWTLFAVLYYIIAAIHEDLHEENLFDDSWKSCVKNLHDFQTAFLFSVESQHTIGYGFRYITGECTHAIIFLCLQSAIGAAIQAFMVGLIFTKVQRPTKRAQTLLFSNNMAICARDSQLCLLFRVGNMRKSLIIQNTISAHLVHHRKTKEGELLPFHQHEMSIQLDSMSGSGFLAWPVTACHVIDERSPLYEISHTTLRSAKFEIIVTLEGVAESTGQTLQARTSYLPEEILWGYKFSKLLSYRPYPGHYVVNFEKFNSLECAPETPQISAADWDCIKSCSDVNCRNGGVGGVVSHQTLPIQKSASAGDIPVKSFLQTTSSPEEKNARTEFFLGYEDGDNGAATKEADIVPSFRTRSPTNLEPSSSSESSILRKRALSVKKEMSRKSSFVGRSQLYEEHQNLLASEGIPIEEEESVLLESSQDSRNGSSDLKLVPLLRKDDFESL